MGAVGEDGAEFSGVEGAKTAGEAGVIVIGVDWHILMV
jgi:hypothetical protein